MSGQKRFIVGGEGADYFLVYARTDLRPEAKPDQALTCFIVDRGPGVETKYLYGLMGCRGAEQLGWFSKTLWFLRKT